MLAPLKNFVKRQIRYPKYSGNHPDSWPFLQKYIRKHSLETEVTSNIHESDFLFHYLIGSKDFSSYEDVVKYYFQDGKRSAEKLSFLLSELNFIPSQDSCFLEFASGYGMVTRHLIKQLYPMQIVSCDIHEKATNFLKTSFGVNTVLSHVTPEKVAFPQTFDIVFALSFFSHIPHITFGRWLTALFRAVKPGGYLIFTTHGHTAAKKVNIKIPESGIFFQGTSEQHDLDQEEYGTAIVTPEYVANEIKQHLNKEVFLRKIDAWWEQQDLFVIQK